MSKSRSPHPAHVLRRAPSAQAVPEDAQAVPEDALPGQYPNLDLCVGQECGLGSMLQYLGCAKTVWIRLLKSQSCFLTFTKVFPKFSL